jgi:hypothetical protein
MPIHRRLDLGDHELAHAARDCLLVGIEQGFRLMEVGDVAGGSGAHVGSLHAMFLNISITGTSSAALAIRSTCPPSCGATSNGQPSAATQSLGAAQRVATGRAGVGVLVDINGGRIVHRGGVDAVNTSCVSAGKLASFRVLLREGLTRLRSSEGILVGQGPRFRIPLAPPYSRSSGHCCSVKCVLLDGILTTMALVDDASIVIPALNKLLIEFSASRRMLNGAPYGSRRLTRRPDGRLFIIDPGAWECTHLIPAVASSRRGRAA